jgi:hypothetical protein
MWLKGYELLVIAAVGTVTSFLFSGNHKKTCKP